jgi:hypothetical protein
LRKKWQSLKDAGKLAEAQYLKDNQLDPSHYMLGEFLAAASCGNEAKMDETYDSIVKVSGCKDCECKDCPTLIIPVSTGGTGGDIIVDSPLGTVQVVEEIVGDITYYHLEVSQSILNIINNLHPVIVQAGTGITVTSLVVGGTTVYTVSLTTTPATQLNHLEIRGLIAPNGSTWDFTPDYIFCKGANMIQPSVTPHDWFLGSNEPTNPAATDFVVLRYGSYQITPIEFTAQANVLSNYPDDTISTIKGKFAIMKNVEAEIMWQAADPTPTGSDTDNFIVRLYSTIDGHIIKFDELRDPNQSVYIRIQVMLKTA